jgi:hypothetical protein
MRYLIVIVALLIALPARAYNAGCSTSSATGCRSCWKGSVTTTTCPNGDWSRRDWSSWNAARRWPSLRRRRGPRAHARRTGVIERETLRYQRVIKKGE